jgi:hypothetical protein
MAGYKGKQGAKRRFRTAKALAKKIEEYRLYIQQQRDEYPERIIPITLTGMIYHIGLGSRLAFDKYKEYGDDYEEVVSRAKLWVESEYEGGLHRGQAAGPIFALKNFGWKDKTEIEHQGGVDSKITYEASMPARGSDDDE